MGITRRNFSWLGLTTLLVASCTSGNCRRDGTMITPKNPGQVKPIDETSPSPGDEASAGQGAFPPLENRVFVYKYDGSKQCGAGQPISVKTMAKELKGMQVFSQENKPDGLMHIQVCGAATGRANVYEIKAEDLAKAQAKGFQEWKF